MSLFLGAIFVIVARDCNARSSAGVRPAHLDHEVIGNSTKLTQSDPTSHLDIDVWQVRKGLGYDGLHPPAGTICSNIVKLASRHRISLIRF